MVTPVGYAIDTYLKTRGLDQLVADFFQNPAFSGHLFNGIANNPSGVFTDGDFVAVGTLGWPINSETYRRLVINGQCDQLLQAIPPKLPIWSATTQELADAKELIKALKTLPGLGSTYASKFGARKRPMLFPIIDKHILRALKTTDASYVEDFAFALGDAALRAEIDKLQPPSGSSSPIHTLRLLDVALWMGGSAGRAAQRARGQILGSPCQLY